MPWYLPWSESIKKRACRYLLQRYLGQFLEEKLTLDQLTVDLYNGTGTVSEVRLDVQALNELGEQQNLPVEFVDGFILEMSVSIPWASLLSDSSYVEVSGLVLTIQPKQRADSGASMFESMWSSMTSSMQLAEECLKQGATSDGKEAETSQPLEGLELFAQTIDSILSRVKVKFVDTTIRLEHVPKESSSGVAVELRIKNMDYFDEAGTDPPVPPDGDILLQQANKVYQVAAFTTKKFHLEGVTLYTDEFPSQARTFSRSVMSMSSSSTPESKNSECGFGTAPVTPNSASPGSPHQDSTPSNLSLEPDPVLFGKLAGRQELRVKLKQTEGVHGPKVNLEINLGSLTTFLSARQLHVLIELLHGLATPDLEDTSNVAPRSRCVEKPMDPSDFHRVEQELQQQLHPLSTVRTKGLQYTQGWSTASLDDSDEEFLPMQGGLSDSVLSDATSLDTSLSSSISSASGLSKSPSQRFSTASSSVPGGPYQQNFSSSRQRKKLHKGSNNSTILDTDSSAEVSHFHVRLSSLAVVLLHEDILTVCVGTDGSRLAHSSVQQMKSVAQDFFSELGFFAVTGYGNKDFEAAREIFLKACQLNHIRLLAAPVIIEGNERTTLQGSSLSGTVTAASLELLECLVDKKTPSQTTSVEYVELLKFTRSSNNEDQQPAYPFGAPSNMKVHFKYYERSVQHGQARRFSHPRTDISVTLQQCSSEIDVSIVDRITALLNPQPLCRRNGSKYSVGKNVMNQQSCFYQAVENPVLSDSKTDIKISSPFLIIKLRFPTPDLRPIHDMDRPPWWKRSVRKDFLTFELTDVSFHTLLDSRESCRRYELQCREIHGLFQEADTENPVPFVRATADDKNGNSLPDGGEGFGWPRIVIQVYPESSHGDLDDMPENEPEDALPQSSLEPLENSAFKEPSPFSSKKVIHESDTPHGKSSVHQTDGEGEELVIPGDKQEMAEFIEYASRNCHVQLEINLPSASAQLISKHIYELIYNRINTDMFLWEPAAPKPKTASPAELYGGKGQGSIDLASTLLQESLYPAFTMCKSGVQYDSDSDSEDTEGVYYSVYEHRQRHKRRQQQLEGKSTTGQSNLTVTLSVGQGVLSVYAPVRDSGGNVIPGQHGELYIELEEGNMFSVSGYKGKSGLGFICLQVNRAAFYHNGLVPTPFDTPSLRMVGSAPPSHLDPTIYKSETGAVISQGGVVGTGSNNSLDMLAVAIKIQMDDTMHNLKTFRVAAGVRGATLRHRMCASSNSWFTQFMDFFDVIDYPIAGYDPPGVITELHMHLWDCAVDYRPLHLPLKSVITMGSFSVSSNIAAQTSTSTLRFIAEDAALFISDKTRPQVDLRRDYVCVLDLGLFELSLRLCQNPGSPRVDLRASNNVLHVRTCADSGRALTELLTYFASDGDLRPVEEQQGTKSDGGSAGPSTDSILLNTSESAGDDNENIPCNLSRSQVEHVHDLMEEAMKESGFNGSGKLGSLHPPNDRHGVEVFFFPDESHPLPSKPLGDSELYPRPEDENDTDENWEDDFCILDKEAGSGLMPRNGLPEVRVLCQEPIRVIEHHFPVPLGKTDLLRAPKDYPAAVLRYTLREMSIVWHMYGGQDFSQTPASEPTKKQVKIDEHHNTECKSCPSSPPFTHSQHYPSEIHIMGPGSIVSFSKSSPTEVQFGSRTVFHGSPKIKPQTHSSQMTWQAKGGPGRQHHVLMELQLNKVRFQHEVYPENTAQASRQVLLISELEVRDRLASSQINKFLYQYSSEARPKQSHANMVVIKAVHIRPDLKLKVQECSLKVSLLPLRLNIDQDSLLFLFNFFTEISGGKKIVDDGSSQSPSARHSTPTHQAPVMTVNVGGHHSVPVAEPQTLLIMLEEDLLQQATKKNPVSSTDGLDNAPPPPPPIFFRSFVFSPEVPIRLDYQGKRVDMTHGPLAGLLMGLGQLNCSELRLKRLSYRHGLLGFDKLLTYALTEWLQDIKKNQLPSLLGGVGPMHALVQLFQGIRDLFWLPIEQYQKDGRIVRGLQRGANSFTTSTAMAALELTNRLVQAIQATAEMAYDMVSPGPSVRQQRFHGKKGRRRRYTQPADIREGMANAYMLVKEGLGETAQTLVRVASEEHEQKGVSGAVGGVLRQIPPTVVKPIILATEATSNVLGGMRSQLVPDARREAVEKWRSED
ncbi:autophagy-related protein 2 homolog A [Anabrus simplex]|uniref:autophagy-related protein 2 homolog A n=1 Tax=Anabrus simplex TaxID=316456 RepID=UPI0035A31315